MQCQSLRRSCHLTKWHAIELASDIMVSDRNFTPSVKAKIELKPTEMGLFVSCRDPWLGAFSLVMVGTRAQALTCLHFETILLLLRLFDNLQNRDAPHGDFRGISWEILQKTWEKNRSTSHDFFTTSHAVFSTRRLDICTCRVFAQNVQLSIF